MNDRDKAAVTPPEYLAGVRSGVASRDGEVSLLNATIRELTSDRVKLLVAMRELLGGHDNLYRAQFPNGDPLDDIAAKAARELLRESDGGSTAASFSWWNKTSWTKIRELARDSMSEKQFHEWLKRPDVVERREREPS